MNPSHVNKGARHWRMRAEEMRAIAEETRDPTAKAMMLRIAADYDRLAKHADNQAPQDLLMRALGDRPIIREAANTNKL